SCRSRAPTRMSELSSQTSKPAPSSAFSTPLAAAALAEEWLTKTRDLGRAGMFHLPRRPGHSPDLILPSALPLLALLCHLPALRPLSHRSPSSWASSRLRPRLLRVLPAFPLPGRRLRPPGRPLPRRSCALRFGGSRWRARLRRRAGDTPGRGREPEPQLGRFL